MTKSAIKAIRQAVVACIGRAFSAVVWFVLLGLGSVALLVSGAYILAGLGVALLVAGGLSMLVAGLLLIGMNRGE